MNLTKKKGGDIARVYLCVLAVAKFSQLLYSPPYFAKMDLHDETIAFTKAYIEKLGKSYYLGGVKKGRNVGRNLYRKTYIKAESFLNYSELFFPKFI